MEHQDLRHPFRTFFSTLFPPSDPKAFDTLPLDHSYHVNYKGVQNLIDAANNTPTLRRIVRLTGVCDTPYSFFSVLINLLGRLAKAYNYQGEMLLRSESKKPDVSWDYTIIRPGIMSASADNEGEEILALADNGEKMPVSRMSYAQVATLCAQVCDYPNCGSSTLTAGNVEPGMGVKEYGTLLENVNEDTKTFPNDLFQKHVNGVRLGATVGVMILGLLIKIVVSVLLLIFELFAKTFD